MKNVFIAVGGSGTKVAEALVRLLAIGFPTRKDKGIYTSAGDSLQIWRVDPDRSAGAAADLQHSLKDYVEIQKLLGDSSPPGVAGSRWAAAIDIHIRHLDPLQLPRATESDNQIKTLRGVLDSQYGGKLSSAPLLEPFYERKDLEVIIDRGFYQKPFIGAAVMAVFAASLGDETSPSGKEASLTAFDHNQTNFFLCGSLHGGTGACGVPVMGRFLGERKKKSPEWGWRIGGCLLSPYCLPPQPPFSALKEGEPLNESLVDSLLKRHTDAPAFAKLTPEEKRELVKQILLGFYADPEDMEARARQGLAYYKDHSADYFDELYLVGKPEPDKLKVWSNGGQSQANPLNSAEIVGAIAALNFFAGRGSSNPQSYVIGASTSSLKSDRMRLSQLPKYRLAQTEDEIDPEKVFLATAVLHHLMLHQIPWEERAKVWSSIGNLRALYEDNESRKEQDHSSYSEAARLISESVRRLVDPVKTIGWSGEDASQLSDFLSNDPVSIRDIAGKMDRRLVSREPKGVHTLGESTLKLTTFEFGGWCPDGDQFSRGEYLRHVWSELFSRALNQS